MRRIEPLDHRSFATSGQGNIARDRNAMWNRIEVIRRRWFPSTSARPKSAGRIATLLVCLAAFGGAAAVAIGAIGKTDAKPEPALTSSTMRIEPNTSEPVHEAATGNPLWALPLAVLAATRDRPLFSPTRRPPAPPIFTLAAAKPPAEPPAERERPPLLLIGTVAGNTKAIALFLDQKTSRTVRLRRGESHDGWVLGTVYRKEVVLRKDDAVAYLPLSAAAGAPAAAPTQVAETRLVRRQR